MPWTAKQQRMFVIAASKAGWNDAQRYMVMRAKGCPVDRSLRPPRPSIKHPSNAQTAFELCMAVAEAAAAERGERVDPPSRGGCWADVERGQWSRIERKIQEVFAEAREKLPLVFTLGTLSGFVRRMTAADSPARPLELHECDAGQLYRVLEGLKAWVQREFAEHGLRPTSFKMYAPRARRTARTNQTGRSA